MGGFKKWGGDPSNGGNDFEMGDGGGGVIPPLRTMSQFVQEKKLL